MAKRDARELARELEERRSLPSAPGRERVRGYVITGLPFESGHLLAMRRFPATSFGPGYTSIWHRDPSGRTVIYQDQDPRCACPRAFGAALEDAPVVPISLEWRGPNAFTIGVDSDRLRLQWDVELAMTPVTRALSFAGKLAPAPVRRNRLVLGASGRAAGPLLGAGKVRLAGLTPNRQEFRADIRRLWRVARSNASIDGADLGEPSPLPQQARLGDFWLPQRGLFAVADAYFERHDPARHHDAVTRRDLEGLTPGRAR